MKEHIHSLMITVTKEYYCPTPYYCALLLIELLQHILYLMSAEETMGVPGAYHVVNKLISKIWFFFGDTLHTESFIAYVILTFIIALFLAICTIQIVNKRTPNKTAIKIFTLVYSFNDCCLSLPSYVIFIESFICSIFGKNGSCYSDVHYIFMILSGVMLAISLTIWGLFTIFSNPKFVDVSVPYLRRHTIITAIKQLRKLLIVVGLIVDNSKRLCEIMVIILFLLILA